MRLRLLEEFRRGKRYGGLPYRVVVHQVIGWTIADHFAGGAPTSRSRRAGSRAPAATPAVEVVSRGWVKWVVSQVEGNDGRVLELRYRDLLEPAQNC